MSRRKPDHPLRPLTEPERDALGLISRSYTESAAHVARAKALLAVADGSSFSEAARRAGRKSGDAVGQLVGRFNDEGLAALAPRHGGGQRPTYTAAHRARVLAEFKRVPDREGGWDGHVVAHHAPRRTPPGAGRAPRREHVHRLGGAPRGRLRVAARTDVVPDRRGRPQAEGGVVTVVDPDAAAKKS